MGVTFLLLGCIGAYFAFVQKPWALFCPGIQTNDLDHLNGTLRKKVDKIMKTCPNQVHMHRFELILCQNRSHMVWDASGMPPGAPGGPWGPKGAQGSPKGGPQGVPPISLRG